MKWGVKIYMQRKIKQRFKFLQKKGFRRKVYFKNGDSQIIYTKNKLSIEINYYLSISFKYILMINIDNNGKWANILECDYFDIVDLDSLKSEIFSIDIEEPLYVEKALTLYADFIEKHI